MKNLNSRQAMAAMLLAAASTSALMAPAAAQTMPVADTQAETRMTTAAASDNSGQIPGIIDLPHHRSMSDGVVGTDTRAPE